MNFIPLAVKKIVRPKTEGNAVVNGKDLAPLVVLGHQELSHPGIAVLDEVGENVEVGHIIGVGGILQKA
jgi:hypothetical protein